MFSKSHVAQYLHLSFLLMIWHFMPLKRIYSNLLHLVTNLLLKARKWVPCMYLIIFDAMIQNNGQTTLKHLYLCYPPSAQREIHFMINNFKLYLHHEDNHIYYSRSLICSYILKYYTQCEHVFKTNQIYILIQRVQPQLTICLYLYIFFNGNDNTHFHIFNESNNGWWIICHPFHLLHPPKCI